MNTSEVLDAKLYALFVRIYKILNPEIDYTEAKLKRLRLEWERITTNAESGPHLITIGTIRMQSLLDGMFSEEVFLEEREAELKAQIDYIKNPV